MWKEKVTDVDDRHSGDESVKEEGLLGGGHVFLSNEAFFFQVGSDRDGSKVEGGEVLMVENNMSILLIGGGRDPSDSPRKSRRLSP